MSDLSKNIKQLRKENGMRQKDFGQLVGVSDKAVWTWEMGRSSPSFDQLCKLADHFGIGIDYFVTGQHKHPDERLEKYGRLLDKIDRLSPEDRWKLEGRIDMMLEQHSQNELLQNKAT